MSLNIFFQLENKEEVLQDTWKYWRVVWLFEKAQNVDIQSALAAPVKNELSDEKV